MKKRNSSKKTQARPEDYNKVVGTAELLDVKLIDSAFTAKAVFFTSERDSLKHSYLCEQVHSAYNEELRVIVGTFLCEAGVKKSRSWVIHAKATYLVVFSTEEKCEREAAISYLDRVGRFTCYPYFRGHFAELCANAGADLPPLPVMRGNVHKNISPLSTQVIENRDT